MSAEHLCPRCGEARVGIETTSLRDTERRYYYVECPCPKPRCPFCNSRIDQWTATAAPGECPNRECFMWGWPVPIPEVA